MTKQKRWIGVTVLAGATVIALLAGTIIKKNMNAAPGDVIAITEDGTNAGIKEIVVLSDDAGNVTGYKVNVETTGYNTAEPIVMAVTFNATADEVTDLQIISQSETDGLGSKITEDEFLKQFVNAKLPVYLEGMAPVLEEVAEATPEATPEVTKEATEVVLVDGTYEATGEESKGYTTTVTVTVADGKIANVNIESIDVDGNKKSVLSETGAYVMTETGPTWAAQAKAIADFIVANQSAAGITMDEEGRTDAVASVSIKVDEYVSLFEEAINKPAKQAVTLVDGTYESTGEESNGYTTTVTVTVADGNITDVNIEAVDADGNKKSVLSETGEYVMTETGPTWAAQAKAIADFIVANQSAAGITMDEEGRTDAVASVSIKVKEYVSLFEESVAKASASEVALNDGTYEATGEESNGYTTTATVTVAGGKITNVNIESVDADGNKKSVLSENGEYVMTETGPTWAAQAKAIADFIVTNQGTTGITMDEEGRTDAVASVSIKVNEYVSLVEEALTKASVSQVALNDGTYEMTGEESNGYTTTATVTVAGGKITNVNIEAVDANGNKKSVLSETGEYVMTETGPTWAAQANAIADFIVANQGTAGITMDEEGRTDAVASVSIKVNEYVSLVEAAIAKAAGEEVAEVAPTEEAVAETEEKEEASEEVAVEGTKVDAVSNATVSTKGVIAGIENARDYLLKAIIK